MQKLVNDPKYMVDESVSGFVKCYSEIIARTQNKRVVRYKAAPVSGKVGVVTGGGSGHDPAFIGYIGRNMLDAVAVGGIFTPPTVEEFLDAFRAADAGKGVACLYGNYIRDIVNVHRAIELAEAEGIQVKTVVANDDVAIEDMSARRGITGEVLLWKIGGAAAALGYDLDGVIAVAQRAMENTRSIGVGLSSCIIPEVGRPNYLIEMGTMEIGVGHHGLSSMDTCKLKTTDATADIMLEQILQDMPCEAGDDVAVMISGLGNTMLSEQNIVFSRIYDVLVDMGVKIYLSFVGNFFTSLDMMGVTLTIMKLDAERKRLLDLPVHSATFNHFASHDSGQQ